MLIGFDASRAFVPEVTGTENYSLNLLKALAKADRKSRYRVYLRGQSGKSKSGVWSITKNKPGLELPYKQGLKKWPKNFEFKTIHPNRLWTQVGLALETWRNPVDILFIPAHTLPILRRRSFMVYGSWDKNYNPDERLTINHKPTKYVVTIHDLGVEYLPGYHQFPQRYYLDFASRYAAFHADGVIAVSVTTKRDLIKRYQISPKKIFVVHEGVDTAFFRPSSKLKVQSVKSKYKIEGDYILFVGTVQPRKNLEMLIKAFSLVVNGQSLIVNRGIKDKKISMNDKLSTINLIIAGKLGWDYQDILAAPKRFGVQDRVKFLGYVPDSDLPALYSGAAVFAFPSLFEGFGLPILEALACGCPVIASDIPPHCEISQKLLLPTTNYRLKSKFVPMILVKPNDVDKWTEILYQTISKYEKRSIIETFKNLKLDSFNWEQTAIDTLQVFRRVLS
ncbi:hypothetical protein A2697_05115 [Candidatus Curtissbacteria bacterium RIFCSPHIGHO2_01_FULL_41_44]|uniref:Glycosyl transferase family 1 domain-containing protein n=1 Tax=Candidatus Curtissbacteria bacterium RIFCSPLOWO2_01_FULL_42_50 TaxID=1797730 RepID=A0A1F5H5L4_9BACT|nr:MAG: hypothetical protein A2697_05115 [Candidatus Curtissbacteria bacterium RIFCSPHIGHO2_01_FULL_41_44]OGD93787.1 MAG: hypothetical protein A3C33_03600 [Candidatus Curtissbacteria bacterium RIFCSPHIGHO2_02_FULL_42_58]OGD96829.1 MAG: hypothetical protein A3E71_02900 [Candidatus Curtissbacteria bacterium RIFCSPHIGHO2_12_FULL_42_33]OGD99453.1 MAG: hypothetical protein A3B54_00990 [Candidatus Curtissbacteria bacterium RIFCSPLOWO2_01_FULL_42_50]OGE03714.1 MAG: hypothetical protein A3G16_02490 [Ca